MIFIGDILDDDYRSYQKLLAQLGDQPSIQVGDFGCGFPNSKLPKSFPSPHRFIRGNHDNPEVCRTHPNYLGDYGYLEDEDLFYYGGAESIDKNERIQGVSWWPEEEIGIVEGYHALDLYQEKKPLAVVSHDCPGSILGYVLDMMGKHRWREGSRTSQILDALYHAHQPNIWVFGHYHQTIEFRQGKTLFVCVGSDEYKEIKWLTENN